MWGSLTGGADFDLRFGVSKIRKIGKFQPDRLRGAVGGEAKFEARGRIALMRVCGIKKRRSVWGSA